MEKKAFLEKLGKRIKYYRELKGITINQMSERTGIRKEYLRKIEDGKAPGAMTSQIVRIALVLDVRMQQLVE